MRHDHAVSSTAHNVRGGAGTLLDLLLESTRDGSGVENFLAELAGLAAEELSHPGREVSCGITVDRRRQASLEAGSTGEGSGQHASDPARSRR